MSLKEFLDANSIANEIRLERQVRKVAVLVVEGSDDRRLFAKLVHPDRCSIVGAYGKDNVVKVVSILDASGFEGILGIGDKDFDEIENIEHTSPNLIFTDEHDLECMMIRSEALFRVLIENATEIKLQAFEEREGAVKDALLKRAQVIGCARLISRRHNLRLDFDEMKFRFIDDENLGLDVDRLVKSDRISHQPVHSNPSGIASDDRKRDGEKSRCLAGILRTRHCFDSRDRDTPMHRKYDICRS